MTWPKDNYELIDYDSNELIYTNLEVNNSGYIYRNQNKIFFQDFLSDKNDDNNDEELLLKIKKYENFDYILIPNDCQLDENKNIKSRNNCWFIFKKSKSEINQDKYKIEQGDIFRFGRITMRVKEIRINKNFNLNKSIDFNVNQKINNILNDKDNEIKNKEEEVIKNVLTFSNDLSKQKINKIPNSKMDRIKISKISTINASQKFEKNKTSKTCRICYGEENLIEDIDNPLVQPCKCSGSLKYIHLNCLKHWLNTKSCNKIISNKNFSMFLVKQIECEICKEKFPDFVIHKKKLFEILDFKSEFENYLALESLTIDKKNNRCIYVINLDNNIKLKIGRGHESHLSLSDITVSRVHCILTIDNKNIYLEDNYSKFGTLILVHTPSLKLVENLPLHIQIGRTFLNCCLEKPKNVFCCCGVYEKPNYNYYFQQNEKIKQNSLLYMFTIKPEIEFSEDCEIDDNEKEKEFHKIKIEEDEKIKNKKYDEITIDIESVNNSKIKKHNDDENAINSIRKSQSLINIEEEKQNNYIENNKDKNKNNNNENDSIILESESDAVN